MISLIGSKQYTFIHQLLDRIIVPNVRDVGIIFALNSEGCFTAFIVMGVLFLAADFTARYSAAISIISRAGTSRVAFSIIVIGTVPTRTLIIVTIINVCVLFLVARCIHQYICERDCIHIPREIHIQHGGALRRDGDSFILIFIEGEMLAILRSGGEGFLIAGMQHGAGGGRFQRCVQNGIIIVIGVFAPIDDGVIHILRLPMRLQHNAGDGGVNAGELRLIQIPAIEGVAQLRGRGDAAQINAIALGNDLGGHAGAAIGIKGDPIGGLGDGHNIGILAHDGFGGEGVTRFLYLPAGEEVILLFIAGGEGDLVAVGGNRLARGKDAAVQRVIRQEIDIENFGEIRVDLHGSL